MARARMITAMEHCIVHACGHEQVHHIPGFTSQQERKARWLGTTRCRTCFIAEKRAEEAEAARHHTAVITGLRLAELTGSERQVTWANTIRAERLAALVSNQGDQQLAGHACLAITNAKWWIDHRGLGDAELLSKA